ncbi:MAG: hotdog fold thioesterase [Cyclobacteriaceae bacterium]|nr:hotdog fold thioesterase [Cyclobacteriaceae bacterium]
MFNQNISISVLQTMCNNTMIEHLGIEFTDIGPQHISAKMPVDHRTHQPLRMLHGGASVVLAETLGSIAANISVNPDTHYCVGLEINANHIRSVRSGFVYGTTKPVHIGKSTQIWEILINNEEEQLVCISRLTIAVLKKENDRNV